MSENFFDSRHYRALSRLHPLQMDLEEYAVMGPHQSGQ